MPGSGSTKSDQRRDAAETIILQFLTGTEEGPQEFAPAPPEKATPSKAAMRAAQNIQFLASLQNRGPMASDHFSVGRLARIIDKEFANQPQDTKENP